MAAGLAGHGEISVSTLASNLHDVDCGPKEVKISW